ncbi:uncharacterized protein G2W53_004552 [Senna tora]|uniref:Retrotransposon gag domain-containing protein n=1 Tax=Senna tora TaxID=362788 RepID=A0A834XDD8_9FABA|nr:uncharacterized protein G2W53_004552 [Senna tora]
MPKGKKKKVVELSPPQIRMAKRRRVIESPPSSLIKIFSPPSSLKSKGTKFIESPEMAEEDRQNVENFATPSVESLQSSITRPAAKAWLQSQPQGSITSWSDLTQKFLAKYFPPAKTAKLRGDITTFKQRDFESLYEEWERFRDMLRKFPHHGVPKWLQVQTFYNGLFSELKTNIDAAANSSLMAKPVNEAYSLSETMAANNYQWHFDTTVQVKSVVVQNNDALDALTAQIAELASKVKNLGVQTPVQAVNAIMPRCEHCGEGHTTEQCSLTLESVEFMANRNANNNPYSNMYNLGWHNHPNFLWTQSSSSEFIKQNLSPLEPALILDSKDIHENAMQQGLKVQRSDFRTPWNVGAS